MPAPSTTAAAQASSSGGAGGSQAVARSEVVVRGAPWALQLERLTAMRPGLARAGDLLSLLVQRK